MGYKIHENKIELIPEGLYCEICPSKKGQGRGMKHFRCPFLEYGEICYHCNIYDESIEFESTQQMLDFGEPMGDIYGYRRKPQRCIDDCMTHGHKIYVLIQRLNETEE